MSQNLRLTNPSIDTITTPGTKGSKNEERLIIRGVIDPTTLSVVRTDKYQREIMAGQKVSALVQAARNSVLPDIELGMRGSSYQVREDGAVYLLQDPVFVIDGAQRINAILQVMKVDNEVKPKIGAVIHIDTNFDWERERFRILNQERSKISPNILLRNGCRDHPGVELVHSLCTQDQSFILYQKVSWDQRQGKDELIPAMRLCRVVNFLHYRFEGGGLADDVRDITTALDSKREKVGVNIVRDNTRNFFAFIDQCWNIRNIKYRDQQPQIKSTFLEVFARFFTDNDEFWDGSRLRITARQKNKLAKFAVTDPDVSRLCGSGGQAKQILSQLLISHFNSGKRINRLASTKTEEAES